MPYIPENERQAIAEGCTPITAGQLNYAIHLLIDDYIIKNGLNYQTCNDVMGALQGVQQEFYRRKVADYENEKIILNGDIDFYKNTK